ncbi:MAG: glutathione S-transferase N-terminal domain-containing protein, partial [Hoeflea sp.]|nr:glutathione S-transferase N-terminal domain-containing protein [Hoeflea sp.]
MEPTLIYGFPAGSSMGLVAALEWLGRPYRLCRVDMLGEMREASYARLNARHETPALVTDRGQLLTETMAIAAWLEARDTDRRSSFDPLSPEADRMRQLSGFINTGFTGAFSPLWHVMEAEGLAPSAQTALTAFGRSSVIERHDKLEQMVEPDRTFLMGDRPTLADGLFIGVARWLDVHQVADRARWPKLSALRDRLDADPAVVFATAMENGKQARGNGSCRGHVALAELIERFGAR